MIYVELRVFLFWLIVFCKGSINKWQDFIAQHEEVFDQQEEHKLSYSDIHSEFVKLVEEDIEEFLR